MHVELVRADRFDGGQDDRQILGTAAGHDRVDRDLLHGRRGEIGRDDRDHVLWVAGRSREHAKDALGRRGNNGKPVGESPVKEKLHRVVALRDLDATRPNRTPPRLSRQPFRDSGLDAA
jgi:hypothetical protein